MNQELISKKKTCSKERLLRVLSAISYLRITYEGEGGKTQGYIGGGYGDGNYQIGTGLRAPDMPFYYKPKATRHAVLKHLEEAGLITIANKEDNSEWRDFEVTVKGLIILEAYNKCEECNNVRKWYKVTSFTRTGQTSGFKSESRRMFCDCSAKKYSGVPDVNIEKIKQRWLK